MAHRAKPTVVIDRPEIKDENGKPSKERYFDPLTGAHFDYLDLFEKMYELKKYRKKIDYMLGVIGSDTVSEKSDDHIVSKKQLRKNESVFKNIPEREESKQSIFGEMGVMMR